MAKFIAGKELVEAVDDIIFNAKSRLLIISPYIRLDSHFKKLFEKHRSNSDIEIVIGFGKNEENVSRSLNYEDFEFFKHFPNIGIVYIPNLHAKYYSNEKIGLVTSINLLDSSFKNNIEFGVLGESSLLGSSDKFDLAAFDYSSKILKDGYAVFARRPNYKKKLLGLAKDYVGSTVEWDIIEDLVNNRRLERHNIFEFLDREKFVTFNQSPKPKRQMSEHQYNVQKVKDRHSSAVDGYCIRCKEQIELNTDKPYCYNCFRIWASYANVDYPENFCHSCGKEERTSMEKPECYSCYTR